MADDNIDKFWQKTLVKKEAVKQSRYSDFRKEALLSSTLRRLSIERVRNHVINSISIQQEKLVVEKIKLSKPKKNCSKVFSKKPSSEENNKIFKQLTADSKKNMTSFQKVNNECNDILDFGNELQVLINQNNIAQQIPTLIKETEESVVQNYSSLQLLSTVSLTKDQDLHSEIKLTDLNGLYEGNVIDVGDAPKEHLFSMKSSNFENGQGLVKIPNLCPLNKVSVHSTLEISSNSLEFLKPVCSSPKRKYPEPSSLQCSQSLPSLNKRRKLVFNKNEYLNESDRNSQNINNTRKYSELLFPLDPSTTTTEDNLALTIDSTNFRSQQQPLVICDTKPIVTSISSLSLEPPVDWNDDFINKNKWKQSNEIPDLCTLNLLNKVES